MGYVLATAGALFLAAMAVRIAYAESAYVAGLDLATHPDSLPSDDLPGRLEHYEEAFRRSPGEALYALRAGQIRLQRARRAGGTAGVAEIVAVRELLERARDLRPLDARIRATLAQAWRAHGDVEPALREARIAIRLAPCSPGILRTAMAVGVWAWHGRRDVAALELVLRAGMGVVRVGEKVLVPGLDEAIAAAGSDLAGDLFEATGRDPELLRFAADVVERTRPEVARTLRESSDGARDGKPLK